MNKLKQFAAAIKTPVLLLVTAASLVYAWQTGHRSVSSNDPLRTDTAIPANARTAERDIVAEGRLVAYPNAEVVVGTDIGGTIGSLPVQEKDRVGKGELLALIKAEDLKAEHARVKAELQEVEAEIRFNASEMKRTQRLLKSDVLSRQQFDKVRRDLDTSRARKKSIEAEGRRIQALIDKTCIDAPISGTVTVRHVDPGETVQAGAKIVTLVDLSRTRVEAEVDEFDAANVRLGDRVTITSEGYDGLWEGRVEEIPDVVSQRRIKPADPSRPSDVRVLLVKIALDGPVPLKLGQRLEVRIHGLVARPDLKEPSKPERKNHGREDSIRQSAVEGTCPRDTGHDMRHLEPAGGHRRLFQVRELSEDRRLQVSRRV
jgi:HlyD family secretion protein